MPWKHQNYRLTLHTEGRIDGAAGGAGEQPAADFEKILTTEVRGEVSREQLVQHVCECIGAQMLLHEDSTQVVSLVGAAVQHGVVAVAQPGALLPLVGRETSAQIKLAVTHALEHEGVSLAFGSLCVAVPEAQIQTSVGALRMDCRVGDQRYVLSAQLTPCSRGAYSECHRQQGGVCTRVRDAPRVQPTGRAQPGTLSHRNHRLDCQEAHARNVLHVTRTAAAEQQFCTREVLSRKVARMRTAGRGGAATVHTVFVR